MTRTAALVLDRIPFGERDLVLTLLTRELGVVSVMARSARGARRFGTALDLLVVSSVGIRVRQAGGLASLNCAEAMRPFPGLFDALGRLEAAQVALVTVRDLLRDAPSSPAAFDRVVETLSEIEVAPSGQEYGPVLRLLLFLLGDAGHAVDLDACPRCGSAFGDAVVLADGSIACRSCHPWSGGVIPEDLVAYCRGGVAVLGRDRVIETLASVMSVVLGRAWTVADGGAQALRQRERRA